MTPIESTTAHLPVVPLIPSKPLLTKAQAVALAVITTLVVGGAVFFFTASLPATLIAAAITAIALGILIHYKYKSNPQFERPTPAPVFEPPKPSVEAIPLPSPRVLSFQQQRILELIDQWKTQCTEQDVAECEQLAKELGAQLLDPITEDNETLLHYLAKAGGPIEFVPFLSANYNILYSTTLCDGYTPLHVAVMHAHQEMTKEILQRSGSIGINIQAKNGMAALHMVTGRCMFKEESYCVVQELLRRFANPNIQDTSGNTPFHFAAARHDAAIMRELKEKSKDALYYGFVKNNNDQTPNDLAHLEFADAQTFLVQAVGPGFFLELETEYAYKEQFTRTVRYFGV